MSDRKLQKLALKLGVDIAYVEAVSNTRGTAGYDNAKRLLLQQVSMEQDAATKLLKDAGLF